jgi:hypothetical protein
VAGLRLRLRDKQPTQPREHLVLLRLLGLLPWLLSQLAAAVAAGQLAYKSSAVAGTLYIKEVLGRLAAAEL